MKKNMMRLAVLSALMVGCMFSAIAQDEYEAPTTEKRERKKNLIVKEYKLDIETKSKTPELDQMITYNERGYKIEEIEYASYGMKARIVYEYDENDRCIKEILYDDKNKVARIRKNEYNEDGTKKAHYNYRPNGKLYSSKTFEYSYK